MLQILLFLIAWKKVLLWSKKETRYRGKRTNDSHMLPKFLYVPIFYTYNHIYELTDMGEILN